MGPLPRRPRRWPRALVTLAFSILGLLSVRKAFRAERRLGLPSGISCVASDASRSSGLPAAHRDAPVPQLLRLSGGEGGSVPSSSSPVESNSTTMTAETIRRLEKLQSDYDYIQKEYLHELEAIEKDYDAKYKQLLQKRAEVVRGRADERPLCGFWIVAMLNHDYLRRFISKDDQKALQYLIDVRTSQAGKGEQGFELEFEFHPSNPYFSDTVLRKTYITVRDENTEEAVDAIHTNPKKMSWTNSSVNLPRLAKAKNTRSFFSWFQAPPGIKKENEEKKKPSMADDFPAEVAHQDPEEEDENLSDEDKQKRLQEDLDIASVFKNSLVPYAYRWFTGEAAELVPNAYSQPDEDEDEAVGEDGDENPEFEENVEEDDEY
mmetsp:Transcript_6234/g.11467  ORF Transcript_6234/g.11467 Transcript_6234/m.11467 type:complete len:377 (+) Transcript_6234:2-1132(+)